jgi:hypothetical protein
MLKMKEVELWQQLAPMGGDNSTEKSGSSLRMTEDEGREIVSQTLLLIEENSYCFWTCRNLDGAVICVVKDRNMPAKGLFESTVTGKRKAMAAYPVYTLDELCILAPVNNWTERMVLEAKKLTLAVVTKVDQKKESI